MENLYYVGLDVHKRFVTSCAKTPDGISGTGYLTVPPLGSMVDTQQAHAGLITVRNEYDIMGRLTALIDDNGNKTVWCYDRFGRKVSETKGIQVDPALANFDAADTTIGWDYNENTGLLDTMQKEDGTLLNYAYDGLQRLAEINVTPTNPTIVVGTTHQAFAYDGLGRKIASLDNNDPSDTSDDVYVSWRYDSLGRQVEETLHVGGVNAATRAVTANYDSTRQKSIVYPNDRVIEYTYHDNGATKEIKDAGPSAQGVIAKYDYIGYRLLVRAMQNNVNLDMRKVETGGNPASWYDGRGMALHYCHTMENPSTSDIRIGFQYQYDRAGNKVYQNVLPAANYDKDNQQYAYDSGARLKSYTRGDANGDVPPEMNKAQTWALDGLGNWSAFSTTDASDDTQNDTRYDNTFNAYTTGTDVLSETHDLNGNLTYQNSTQMGARTFAWDAFNRLASATVGEHTHYYSYDSGNRRVMKIDNSISPAAVTHYGYSGWQVLEERDAANSDALLRQFVDGALYIDEHLVMDTDTNSDGDCCDFSGSPAGAARYFYHSNTLYSVYALTDASGAIVERYAYDPYGRAFIYNASNTQLTASAIANPYTFTGQRLDSETGLMYYRNRYYDTASGRFISQDPIGYEDAECLFSYIKSDPSNNLDAMGLMAEHGCRNVPPSGGVPQPSAGMSNREYGQLLEKWLKQNKNTIHKKHADTIRGYLKVLKNNPNNIARSLGKGMRIFPIAFILGEAVQTTIQSYTDKYNSEADYLDQCEIDDHFNKCNERCKKFTEFWKSDEVQGIIKEIVKSVPVYEEGDRPRIMQCIRPSLIYKMCIDRCLEYMKSGKPIANFEFGVDVVVNENGLTICPK